MKFPRPFDMSKAMRLAQRRLAKATALLQRYLRRAAPARNTTRAIRTIDVHPRTGELPRSMPQPGVRSRAASRPIGAQVTNRRNFMSRRFSGAAGSRDYMLYVPALRDDAPVPLFVMLHGCKQSPEDFATGTGMNRLADDRHCLIAYPAQSKSANSHRCWNWFNPAHQKRDQGEPSLIAGITREVMANHRIDPTRIYVAGLSAGGAAAAIMGQTYPDLYAAVGVHSGLAWGAARDLPSAIAAMHKGGTMPRTVGRARRRFVPTIVFHADQDSTVHPSNADQVIAQAGTAPDLRVTVEHGQVPEGRAYTRQVHVTPDGQPMLEQWLIHGGGHAWSGGSATGSYTDPLGPDASLEMLRFFARHRLE